MDKPEYENGPATAEDQPEGVFAQEQRVDTAPAEGEEITVLRSQLENKEKEAKANYDLFLRERAETENFKRRMQREKAETLRFANEPLIRALLPVLDNLERAVSHAQGSGNGQSLVDGVALILRSFLETLEKHGVSRVNAKGQPFDPNKHEAMAQVETAEVPPNTVVDEYTPAYLLHDRLLRPAHVTVAKVPTEEKKTEA
jgi:molecular chaperone GrpE